MSHHTDAKILSSLDQTIVSLATRRHMTETYVDSNHTYSGVPFLHGFKREGDEDKKESKNVYDWDKWICRILGHLNYQWYVGSFLKRSSEATCIVV